MAKTLNKLFPSTSNEEKFAIIVDDNPQIWNFSPNLFIIRPFNFFYHNDIDKDKIIPFEELFIFDHSFDDNHLIYLMNNLIDIYKHYESCLKIPKKLEKFDVRLYLRQFRFDMLKGLFFVFDFIPEQYFELFSF